VQEARIGGARLRCTPYSFYGPPSQARCEREARGYQSNLFSRANTRSFRDSDATMTARPRLGSTFPVIPYHHTTTLLLHYYYHHQLTTTTNAPPYRRCMAPSLCTAATLPSSYDPGQASPRSSGSSARPVPNQEHAVPEINRKRAATALPPTSVFLFSLSSLHTRLFERVSEGVIFRRKARARKVRLARSGIITERCSCHYMDMPINTVINYHRSPYFMLKTLHFYQRYDTVTKTRLYRTIT